MCLFHRHVDLMKGILVSSSKEKDGVTVVKSPFNDTIWNFVVPEKSFNPENFQELIDASASLDAEGIAHSLYVERDREAPLLENIERNGYKLHSTDCFIIADKLAPFEVELEDDIEFVEVNESMREKHIEAAMAAFPEYDNERTYTEHFLSFGRSFDGRELRNFVLKKDDEIISFGSVVFDPAEKLAYLHNAGTAEKHRRQGHFERFRKLTLNYLMDQGVEAAYAIVDEGGASSRVLAKLGFTPDMHFGIFVK